MTNSPAMGRPDDVPQDVWDAALEAARGAVAPTPSALAMVIACRAILSERAAERERCAKIAEAIRIPDYGDQQEYFAASSIVREIAAAIREPR